MELQIQNIIIMISKSVNKAIVMIIIYKEHAKQG